MPFRFVWQFAIQLFGESRSGELCVVCGRAAAKVADFAFVKIPRTSRAAAPTSSRFFFIPWPLPEGAAAEGAATLRRGGPGRVLG